MSVHTRTTILGVLACSAALVAQQPANQQAANPQPANPQPANPQQPTFRAEANYVRVDMYPTLNGVPVADLRQDEIEILDNGVPQKIEQFERVQIRAAGSQDARVEPNTVRESREMLSDPRARVFVVFLDIYHVEVADSHRIRAPLVKMLDDVIGDNDLVAVMTPDMSPTDLTFARKTTTIDGFLTRYWYWGERDRTIVPDQQDQLLQQCAMNLGLVPGTANPLINRRHEKMSLDALGDLVTYLRGVREERKAIIAVTQGWLLYRPDASLLPKAEGGRVPGAPDVHIDPRSGKLTSRPDAVTGQGAEATCDTLRLELANMDDELEFRELLQRANRANASFYPVDPRGLGVFDTPISDPAVRYTPPSVDMARVTTRVQNLRTLADETDGVAVVNTNDLGRGMKRIVDDLTSYYLLGYYTTAPLDGKYHSITVRVKRPGVQVRARRGYLSPTREDVRRLTAAAAPPDPAKAAAVAESRAIGSVIEPLDGYSREAPLRLRAVSTSSEVWVQGEFGAGEAKAGWTSGGTIDLLLTRAGGETVSSGRATVAAGSRAFEASLKVPTPGDYDVQVRAKPMAGETRPISQSMKVTAGPSPAGMRYLRRGPSTMNRFVPAADLRFRRSETIRVEWPAAAEPQPAARLLDRTGKPLPIPVSASVKGEDGGWLAAELALTPLGAGDYVIELTVGSERKLAGFRVIP